LEWLLKLKPDADEALKIAALGHDIERAIEHRKVKLKDYGSYDEFKEAHALNSARILEEIMKDCNVRKELIDDVFFLVSHHETGGDGGIVVLRDADSISFFHVNLPYYFVRNSIEETKRRCLWGYKKLPKNLQKVKRRCLWGYKKLPKNLQKVVVKFNYEDKKLESLVRVWIAHS